MANPSIEKYLYWRKVRALSSVLSLLCVGLVCTVGIAGPWRLPMLGLGPVLLGFLACLVVFALIMDRFE